MSDTTTDDTVSDAIADVPTPLATPIHVPLKGYDKPPVPYKEVRDDADPMWYRDFYDDAIPEQRGFITDMIFHSRGYETPTLSVIWTALFILSAVIKREAWYKWTPRYLFTNQYIIIVGPAGVVKKTTAVTDIGYPILSRFRQYIKDPQLAGMKYVHIVKGKITPEALVQSMLPENKPGTAFHLKDKNGEFIMKNGKTIMYGKTSEAALVISELSVFLSKASYQSEMIQILLDLYDTLDEWPYETKGGGKKMLRNLHTNMFGATTVDGLRNSIPQSAKGDGFLSRTILVHIPDTKRSYRRPFIPKKAPSTDELAKRLAWIAEHTLGEYDLSPEADAYMEEWYQYFSKRKRENPAYMAAWSRMDVNVYKTALLIRAQRYDDTNHEISLTDLKTAIKLLDLTYSSLPYLMSQISDDDIVVAISTLENFIKKRKKVTRAKILQGTRIRSDIATFAINELIQRHIIEASFDGEPVREASIRTQEVYEYVQRKNDGTDEASLYGEDESINYSGAVWVDSPDGEDTSSKPHGAHPIYTEGANRVKKQRVSAANRKAKKEVKGESRRLDAEESWKEIATERKGHRTINRTYDRSGKSVPVARKNKAAGTAKKAGRSKTGNGVRKRQT